MHMTVSNEQVFDKRVIAKENGIADQGEDMFM